MKRNINDIDIDLFKSDISNGLSISRDSDIETAVLEYNTKLRNTIDDHVPLQTQSVKIKRNTRWFNDQIRNAKIVRRRLERKMNNFLVKTAKTEFLKKTVCESKNDIKQLFRTTKSMLTWQPDTVLPDIKDGSVMAPSFSEYFINKIVKINTDLKSEKGRPVASEIHDILCADSVKLD